MNLPIEVSDWSSCVLCQEEGRLPPPSTGLPEVEQDHGEELLPTSIGLSDVLTRLCDAEWFTTLDLCWGFNNVRLKEGDEWKVAFSMN